MLPSVSTALGLPLFPSRAVRWLAALGIVFHLAPQAAADDHQPAAANPAAQRVPVAITGELEVLQFDDFANGRGELRYQLRDHRSGRRFNLRFEGEPPGQLRSGAVVTARGQAAGDDIYLAANGGENETSLETVAPAITAVSGEQSTLVMIGNFSNDAVSCPVADIQDLMFSDPAGQSIDALYQETSFGEVWFSGQTVGPYRIDYTGDVCDYSAWADAVDAAARVDGIEPTDYQRRVYVMPSNVCPGAGIGNVGGNRTRAWIFHCAIPDLYAHELGHNLGMHHAATPSGEYGDNTDFMGIGQNKWRQVNAPHKEQMGWIQATETQIVTQSGLYDIAPLELNPWDAVAPQVLKIFKADTDEYYYLSFRRGIGFDANLTYSKYLDRLSIHRYPADSGLSRTYLLALAADGESFTDDANGITVTTLSHNDDYLTVSVNFADGGCTPATPMLTMAPSVQSAAAGTTLAYSVSVSNTDRAECAASRFDLAASLPAGWSGSVSPATLTLAPGGQAAATLSVSSSSSAGTGNHSIGVSLSDSAETAHTTSASAVYAIEAGCTATAPVISLSPSSQSAGAGTTLQYALTLANRDAAGCAESTFRLASSVPGGWSSAVSPATLTLAPGGQATATLSVSSAGTASAGHYSVAVSVADSADPAHAASDTAIYSVTASCLTAAPVISLSPSSQSAGAGTTLQYALTLANRDAAGCAESTFRLASSVPGGWSSAVSPATLTLAPGGQATATLSVSSAGTASAGHYSVAVSVADSADPAHAASDTASYEVSSSADSTPPGAPTGLSADVKRKQVNLSWNAATDNVAVTHYQVRRNGTVLARTTEPGYADRAVANGETYRYEVLAFDAADNVSAPSAGVTVGFGGSGGNGNNRGRGNGNK